MLSIMSRPPSSPWMQEPLTPRHMPPHPQDHQSHGPLRLPPPSSLVGGASSAQMHPSSRGREATYTHNQYTEQYPPSSATGSRFAAPEPGSSSRRQSEVTARISPMQSPTVDHEPENSQDYMRLPRNFAEQSSSRPLHPQSHVFQNKQGPSTESQYPQAYVRAPPPPPPPLSTYPARDSRPEPSQPRSAMLPPRFPQPTASEPREAGRMSISGLLSNDVSRAEESKSASKAPALQHPTALGTRSSKYRIRIRQQPIAARSCGFGERDRRVIDPPPIIQMTIEDPNASQKDISNLIRYPFAVIHCTIWSEDGTADCSAMPEEFRSTRRLMGTTVSSPFVGQDENNQEGCFFCFPDLSCRTPGTFRLKFALVVLGTMATSGSKTPLAATVMSEPFKVYNAKDFPGMTASTPLTKKLKEQGCLISIKKGNERQAGSAHSRDSADEEDDDDDDGAAGGRSRAKRSRRV